MGTKLNQIIAVEKGVKAQAHRDLTNAYQKMEKRDQLVGFSKTYRPKDELGEKKAPEGKKVQHNVKEAVTSLRPSLARLMDVVSTKEVTNAVAKADVVVNGTALIKDAPVTFLLFLEKQLVDLHTFVSKLPTLAPDQDWSTDPISGLWKTPERESQSTKKDTQHRVIVQATDKFPAQVVPVVEDVVVGYWQTVNFSGEISPVEVQSTLARIEDLQRAVKYARESANSVEAIDKPVGDTVLSFVFGS